MVSDKAVHFVSRTKVETSIREQVRRVKAGRDPAVSDIKEAPWFFKLWRYVVKNYTRFELTKTGDKLIALSGLSDVLKQASNDECLAGLWKSHLPVALLWHRWTDRNFRVDWWHPNKQRSARAPSWSWACLNGPVFLVPWRDDADLSWSWKPLANVGALAHQTSSAHPRAQTPSKCCSGCSPSPHPFTVPVWGPY
jgi:hypothetical protein